MGDFTSVDDIELERMCSCEKVESGLKVLQKTKQEKGEEG